MELRITQIGLAVSLLGLICFLGTGCATSSGASRKAAHPETLSSFDAPKSRSHESDVPAGSITFKNAELNQVLAIYQDISRRTVIRSTALTAAAPITLRTQTPLTRVEVLRLLDTVLAENNVAMVLSGDTAVKAVPVVQAAQASPPEISLPWQSLPDSSSFMMRTVQLKRLRPTELVPVLMPFSKAPMAVLPIDSRKQILLRDYSSNIRKMLKLIEDLEKNAK